jgi:hypothetical protein
MHKAPTEHRSDRDGSNDELQCAVDQFLKYRMQILLGYFNANIRREDIFKTKIGNENLYEISNDNEVRIVNIGTL